MISLMMFTAVLFLLYLVRVQSTSFKYFLLQPGTAQRFRVYHTAYLTHTYANTLSGYMARYSAHSSFSPLAVLCSAQPP